MGVVRLRLRHPVRLEPELQPPVFGSLAFVYGTVMTSAIAMLIALPLGVGTAAYLSEIASGRLSASPRSSSRCSPPSPA